MKIKSKVISVDMQTKVIPDPEKCNNDIIEYISERILMKFSGYNPICIRQFNR